MTSRGGGVVGFQPRLWTATKSNQLLEDVTDRMISGSVTLDLDADGSKMTFEAQLRKSLDVRPLGTFVAPFLELTFGDGSSVMEQCGLFVLVPAPAHHAPGGTIYELDGRDLCWLLDANQTPVTVTDGNGSNLIGVAHTAMGSVGYTRRNIPASTKTHTKANSWPPGTSRLKRINDRLNMASYYTLWFDRHGIATSVPYFDLATAEPAVTFSDAPGTYVVPPIEEEPDMTRLCNRVVVIGTDPANAQIISTRQNNDPTSPTSWLNIGNPTQSPTQGNWITRTFEDSTIQTQEAADAKAEQLLREGASYYRKLTLATLPDPTRNPREVYELDIHNDDGDVVADGKWWCSGWTLSLDPQNPVMVHQLNRVEQFSMNIGGGDGVLD